MSTTIGGNVRPTGSLATGVELFFDYLGGIRDFARTAVRCHHHCAGDWAETCLQEPGLPHTCNRLPDHRPHHERVVTIPNQTVRSSAICICVMGVFGVVYIGSLTLLRSEFFERRFDRYRYAVVPFLAYLVLFSGGLLLRRSGQIGLDVVAAGIVMLLNAAIRNSWSMAIGIISSQD